VSIARAERVDEVRVAADTEMTPIPRKSRPVGPTRGALHRGEQPRRRRYRRTCTQARIPQSCTSCRRQDRDSRRHRNRRSGPLGRAERDSLLRRRCPHDPGPPMCRGRHAPEEIRDGLRSDGERPLLLRTSDVGEREGKRTEESSAHPGATARGRPSWQHHEETLTLRSRKHW
jgi:hypothetical protein